MGYQIYKCLNISVLKSGVPNCFTLISAPLYLQKWVWTFSMSNKYVIFKMGYIPSWFFLATLYDTKERVRTCVTNFFSPKLCEHFIKCGVSLSLNMLETCLQTWSKHVFWVQMCSNSKGIVRKSQLEVSVHEEWGVREGENLGGYWGAYAHKN